MKAPSTTFNKLCLENNALRIDWADGKTSKLAAVWLRDHCQMPESRNPDNGQRLFNVNDIPPGLSIERASVLDQGHVEIRFSPDGHRSVFSLNWLRENCYCLNQAYDDRSEKSKTLWDRASMRGLSFVSYPDYLDDSAVKLRALQSVHDSGFVLFKDVPCKDSEVLKVIETFGFVRETNYGKLFNVKTAVSPNNLAYTNLGLGSHADNPYRDPVPTLQLLHCLENSVDGGESVLVDGYHAAATLREEFPEYFDILSSTWINYRFSDQHTDLHSRVPMIEVDDNGHIIKVRYNNRSIAPIRIPPAKVEAFYSAYRCFAELLEREEHKLKFQLKQGDLMLFDNTRIMHARTAFSDSGSRHLQGAYSDLDGLYSTLAIAKKITKTT